LVERGVPGFVSQDCTEFFIGAIIVINIQVKVVLSIWCDLRKASSQFQVVIDPIGIVENYKTASRRLGRTGRIVDWAWDQSYLLVYILWGQSHNLQVRAKVGSGNNGDSQFIREHAFG